MAEDGAPAAVPEHEAGKPLDTARCPYGHVGQVYLRYGCEAVCARCGTRIVNFPGVALG